MPEILNGAVQARAVEVVAQAHVVRAVAKFLRRTPEERVIALVVVIPIVAPAAGRQRREPERIRTVAAFAFIFIPAASGLEDPTGCGYTAHRREQRIPFRGVR